MIRIVNTAVKRQIYTSTTSLSSSQILHKKGTYALLIASRLNAVAPSASNKIRFFSTSGGGSNSWNWAKTSSESLSLEYENSPIAEDDDDKEMSIDPSVQSEIIDKCTSLHSSIMPLNEKIRGPLAKNSDKGTALPFVFLVGNHSSGKSSFINYVLGRNVQTAGVAPTDDCFTVIAPGPTDTGK